MHIVFNALALPACKTGGGVYMINLIRAISRMENGSRISVLVNRDNKCHFQDIEKYHVSLMDCGPATISRPTRIIWEQMVLPSFIRRLKADILHAPGFVLPLAAMIPSVLTIFDMTFFSHSDKHEFMKQVYFKHFIPPSAKKANIVITISHSAAAEIERYLGIDERKIRVTHLAADRVFHPRAPEAVKQTLRSLGIPDRYILSVGTLEPRKNIPLLLSAYAELPDDLRSSYPLVLVGKEGWGRENLQHKAETLGISRHLFFTGYLTDNQLADLYAAAALFIYPSLYEGFGLPVLEAMASGIPVLTSCVSSMPEVAGKAALLVNPHDPASIATGIVTVLTDSALAERMIARGLERALQFSWEKTAAETFEAYEQAIG
ncbi:MAG: glycosyltransferase family 1 protein [bacterium]|jgi:glycosyltransferase involved in cell wall biosynthesis|nr:glycosyltransferase family 1 protein [bacterium]MDD3805510.1 glycosyltransferase family 1 protein [bacterium]